MGCNCGCSRNSGCNDWWWIIILILVWLWWTGGCATNISAFRSNGCGDTCGARDSDCSCGCGCG